MVKVGKIRNNFIYVPEDPPQKPSLIPIVLLIGVWPVGTLIALYLAYKRGRSAMTRKKYQLYRRYANAIGARAVESAAADYVSYSVVIGKSDFSTDGFISIVHDAEPVYKLDVLDNAHAEESHDNCSEDRGQCRNLQYYCCEQDDDRQDQQR